MLDPISHDAKARDYRFWRTSYWGNAPAFDMFMASLTLALRGENVDRVSGDLGQEVVTANGSSRSNPGTVPLMPGHEHLFRG